MAVSLTRVVTFTAMHRYFVPAWSAERNRETFGPLGHAPGHSHDYRCRATVTGDLAQDGTIMALPALDDILHQEVVEPLHQQHLNEVIPEFAYGRLLPTCEALAAHLYPRIASRLPPGVVLERLRVAEDATLYADCTGLPPEHR